MDSAYDEFKSFAEKQGYSIRTETEKLLEESMNNDDTLLGSEVQEKYKDLLLAINKGKVEALDTYREEIQKKLEDELVKRYFYRDGLYEYYLSNDDAILSATALLKDNSRYRSLLN